MSSSDHNDLARRWLKSGLVCHELSSSSTTTSSTAASFCVLDSADTDGAKVIAAVSVDAVSVFVDFAAEEDEIRLPVLDGNDVELR